MPSVELTQAIVHELLLYDPFTGTLTWRRRDRRWFTTDGGHERWNRMYAGKPAFTHIDDNGHLRRTIFNKCYQAHRVIWLYMTGIWPHPEVDHINRKGADNRWSNLRQVTRQQNMRNQSRRKPNSSGHTGIWSRYDGKWEAMIGIGGGQKRYLGRYSTLEEAVAVREQAERQYDYSPGHGLTGQDTGDH